MNNAKHRSNNENQNKQTKKVCDDDDDDELPSPGVKPRAFRLVDKVPELGDAHL